MSESHGETGLAVEAACLGRGTEGLATECSFRGELSLVVWYSECVRVAVRSAQLVTSLAENHSRRAPGPTPLLRSARSNPAPARPSRPPAHPAFTLTAGDRRDTPSVSNPQHRPTEASGRCRDPATRVVPRGAPAGHAAEGDTLPGCAIPAVAHRRQDTLPRDNALGGRRRGRGRGRGGAVRGRER